VILPATVDPKEVTCRFVRDGQRLIVHLDGPPVGRGVEQAIAVRVLDAVWRSGRTYGDVDVSYHPTELAFSKGANRD